jgi:CheY-like chemotaxis protein
MSGAEAIEKVNGGKTYDVILMDHLMPGMTGIEAVRQLRALGYRLPIIALTANAVSGQAEMFLRNGFDGFISKPIDTHQLNTVMLKHIRDKQPSHVVAAARASGNTRTTTVAPQRTISPQLTEMFLRDAAKAMHQLELVYASIDNLSDETLESCVFNFHAIKGALSSIGDAELAEHAGSLEQAGRDKNIAAIQSEVSSFLGALRGVIAQISEAKEKEEFEDTLTEEDTTYLHAKLHAIREACAAYDATIIKGILKELRQKRWTHAVSELLKNISRHLLHSEYSEIEEITEKQIHK